MLEDSRIYLMTERRSPADIERLAKRQKCPRCDFDKTWGNAICRRCRSKLPQHMREGLEKIRAQDPNIVMASLRAAANYFRVHFQSVRNFGGGRRRPR